MIFSLDVRRARKGDCLLLHYGTRKDPKLMVIDGGPRNVYKPHLWPRLEEIRRMRGLGASDALIVDVLMISHVDDDHIQGILDLTKEEIVRADAHQPLMLNVLDLWHNSFDEIIGAAPAELTASVRQHFGAAAATGGGLDEGSIEDVEEQSAEDPEVVQSGLAVLASIEQGFRLRQDAIRLNYPLNATFGGKLILASNKTKPTKLDGGLEVIVAGPMKPELEKLHKKHQKWLQDMKARGTPVSAALAAYIDKSVPNLSSLVMLAKAGGKRILLTGDARGDKILKGLELVGLLARGEAMHVDVLKVPHHGSANNLDSDFFERVVADHYVFSGNGEHGNPEREALELLFDARREDPFIVHLTYPPEEIDTERKKDWEKERAKEKKRKATKPSTKVRPVWSEAKHGVASFLDGLTLASGQAVRIVDGTTAHIVDLLDRLR